MKNPKYAYSPCGYARKYDAKHIRCRRDNSVRHVGRVRGRNACNPSVCPQYRLSLWAKIRGLG